MDVSVIIVNYKTVNLLEKAVYSVISTTAFIEFEIIVVDNGSGDDIAGLIGSKFPEKVRVVSLPENIGFGRANNDAVKISAGRNIFFLNPDTIVLNNAVKILSDYLDNHKNCGIAGGNLFDMTRHAAFSYRMFLPSLLWEFNDMLLTLPEKLIFNRNASFNNSGRPINVAYISGADLMISRHLLERTGGFDPDFFLYFEETDLACRVKKHGYKITSVPDAWIIHNEGASFSNRDEALKHYFSGKLTYYSKHYGRIYRSILNLIIRITFMTRILLFSILKRSEKTEYWKRLFTIYSAALK